MNTRPKTQQYIRRTFRIPSNLVPEGNNVSQYLREALIHYHGMQQGVAEQQSDMLPLAGKIDALIGGVAALNETLRDGFAAVGEKLGAIEKLLSAGAIRPADVQNTEQPMPPKDPQKEKEEAEAAYEKMRMDLLGPFVNQFLQMPPKGEIKKRGAV